MRETSARLRAGRTVRLEGADDLPWIGMAPRRFLRKDRPPARRHFEHPSRRRDEAERCDVIRLVLEDLFRHTDGMGKVPSADAVFDRNLWLAGHQRHLRRMNFFLFYTIPPP